MEHTLTTSELKGTIRINVDDFQVVNNYFKEYIEDYIELKCLCFSSDNSDYLSVVYFNNDKEERTYDLQNYTLQSFLSLFRKHETIIYSRNYLEE